MADTGMTSLKAALGLSTSIIAAEHFYSFNMSSPWSVDKFTQSQEDEEKVWTLFWESAAGAIVTAAVIGILLGDPWALVASLVGAIAIVAWAWYDYSRAVKHDL